MLRISSLSASRLHDLRKFSNVIRRGKSTSNKVELTQVRYPKLKRGGFATLNDRHLTTFKNILPGRVLTSETDDLELFNTDWLRTVRGNSSVVLRPKTTEEISEILKFCNQEKLAVCPQGGNTGLVGGSVPVFDEVILSTSLMKKIDLIDTDSGVVVCEAGCILEDLDNALKDKGLMMPLDLGAKGSCQIGGNISTNAGGLRLLRYGSMHANTLGLIAVKADGTIVDSLSCLKKDNTGYALHHLFIGSEGTLGVVTKVAIQCPPAPKAVSLMFLGLKDFESVLKTTQKAKHLLGEILSSCELMDLECADAVEENMKIKLPLEKMPFYVILESSGSNSAHDEEKLNTFLEVVMGEGLVIDGTVITEPSRIKSVWHIRECIAEALLRDGYVYKYDITLPARNFYDLVPFFNDKVKEAGAIRCCGFGHLGDGNVHFNVTSSEFSYNLLGLIEPLIYEWTSKHRGSVSAEHGIGLKKKEFLKYSKSEAAIEVMRGIKSVLDPNGILNPYKVLPSIAE
ncbi:D-2-hydroxyglutarate dehydrogenase, mitochondrial-like [Neocloeon triangulifer]|uniref:D-2-hydroxyglutarate dehydrogenase, mitochondrial-like n=1 Tax=Neocloeon triangulifer TaxID=2078957 RepID=UPI00286F631C|nr:D-2-hydroxyglutarate dehydrogenase, mitochondrial-like [Neocloeon triangulifer]